MAMNEKFSSEFSVQICALLDQAVEKIDHCLDQLDDEQIWWRPEKGLNSIGNLLLHICGNLRQWCIVPVNDLPDNRKREAEFTTDHMDRKELLDLVNSTVGEAKQSIRRIAGHQLLSQKLIQGFHVNLMNALLHTTTHFQGHTHQIIYLTRLQKKETYRFHFTVESDRNSVPM